MRILVTGSSGFIGSRLSARLRAHSHHAVTGVDPRGGRETNRLGKASEECAGEEYDIIFHLGAMTDIHSCETDPMGAWSQNVWETLRLSTVVRAKRAFVYANSVASLTPNSNIYAHTKAEAAWLLAHSEKRLVNVILPNIYGPGGKGVVSKFICEKDPVIYGSGRQTRHFAHVDDAVELFMVAGTTAALGVRHLPGENETVNGLARMLGRSRLRRLPARPFDVEHPSYIPAGRPLTSLREGLRKTLNEMDEKGGTHYARLVDR
jgi:nucleoside-diphosphate-sugar epimerase